MQEPGSQDRNFLALGGFSPLRIRSAPNALPSAGQPYFGPNTLFTRLQELTGSMTIAQAAARNILRSVAIVFFLVYNAFLAPDSM